MLLCSFNLVSILTAFVVVAALLEGEPSHPGQHASTFHFTSSTLKRATKYAVLFNTSMHRFAKVSLARLFSYKVAFNLYICNVECE